MNNKIYKLTSENLTNLCGSMGSEYTYPNWIKYYSSIKAAKIAAERDYKKPVKWVKRGKEITSGDLGYVMYGICEIKIEE